MPWTLGITLTLTLTLDKGCLAGLQGSVLDISVKEDNPNYDAPVVSDNDTDASSAGSETESEDSEFISCPM